MARSLVDAFCGGQPFMVLGDVDANCRHSGADIEEEIDEGDPDDVQVEAHYELPKQGFHTIAPLRRNVSGNGYSRRREERRPPRTDRNH